MSNILSYIIAVLAPIAAIYLIFALDLFGTGKGTTILICLLWGAFGAVGLAYLINRFSADMIGVTNTITLTAPFTEELLKALVLLYFIRRPTFRYFVDGAVYGFAVGMGFAITENLFYIFIDSDGEVLSLIIKRALSSSLMHGFASAILGISLGLMRRVDGWRRVLLPFWGLALAISIHLVYNNIVTRLKGTDLLLVAFGVGIGGSLLIAALITWGLNAEKRRFSETLGISLGISGAERRAVQQLGGQEVEIILKELAVFFGQEKANLIREMLITQANIGILKNNLKGQVSERLRTAWEQEINELREKFAHIRDELGVYVMMLLRSLLPADEDFQWTELREKITRFDPGRVHTFDLFMLASEMTDTLPPDQLEKTSDMLKRIKIFAEVPLADLENLSRAITPRHYDDEELIFSRGDEGDSMLLIEEGYVEIYTLNTAGQKTVLKTVGIGEVFGELALIDGLPRSAWARAIVPVKAWSLQREYFLMFTRSRPKVVLAILRYLAHKIRMADEFAFKNPQADPDQIFKRIDRVLRGFGSFSDAKVQERASRRISGGLLSVGLDDGE